MFEEALRKIKTALDTLQFAHALIGAYALAFHKVVPATEDLDLLLDCGLSEANSLAKGLSSRRLVSKFVRDTHGGPLPGVIKVEIPVEAGSVQCDLLLPSAPWQSEAVKNAVSMDLSGLVIPVVRASVMSPK